MIVYDSLHRKHANATIVAAAEPMKRVYAVCRCIAGKVAYRNVKVAFFCIANCSRNELYLLFCCRNADEPRLRFPGRYMGTHCKKK